MSRACHAGTFGLGNALLTVGSRLGRDESKGETVGGVLRTSKGLGEDVGSLLAVSIYSSLIVASTTARGRGNA